MLNTKELSIVRPKHIKKGIEESILGAGGGFQHESGLKVYLRTENGFSGG